MSNRQATQIASRTPAARTPSGLLQRKCACGTQSVGGAHCEECKNKEEKNTLRRSVAAAPGSDRQGGESPPPIVTDVLRSPGTPLDVATRAFFEPRFGRDFSHVRLHTSPQAERSAQAIDASAYTVGSSIVMSPGGEADRRLLAHELAHVVQSGHNRTPAEGLRIGTADSAAEHEADTVADAVMRHEPVGNAQPQAGPAVRRAPGTGPGWTGSAGPNKDVSTASGMRRIPIEKLDVGHQSSAKAASGKAIVLLPDKLDPKLPAEILLHFHGFYGAWSGYEESGGKVRDREIDRIDAQMQAAGRTQVIAILPQGGPKSQFGVDAKGNRVFSSDTYIDTVLSTLQSIAVLPQKPSVSKVLLTGHSGAGELINEKLLPEEPGSSLPTGLAEVVLFDAINGPREFTALQRFLGKRLTEDLASIQALADEPARLNFLKTSFRFRAHYSHGPKTGAYYSQWHVGPVPKARVRDPRPIAQVLSDFFAAHEAALGGASSSVYQAFRKNYQVLDAGAIEHETVVGDSDRLKDALQLMPRLEASAAGVPQVAPSSVHSVLRSSGRTLADSDQQWAQQHFHRDFSAVRIHDDAQAAASAREMRAHAYTVGRDVVFAAGRYAPGSSAGRNLLAHELTHVVQQGELDRSTPRGVPANLRVGAANDHWEHQARSAEAHSHRDAGPGLTLQRAPATVDAAMCEANANPNPAQLGTCSYKEPEHCPTFEGWISTFARLKTFAAVDTPSGKSEDFSVIGGEAADVDFRPASKPPKAPTPVTVPLRPGERFIDHPTDEWVKTCLPSNLRATAYQLPADCADVAMILRHVWLAAHHRTEAFGKWTLGDGAGKAAAKSVHQVIAAEGTGTVAAMVAPYSNSNGEPLRSFKDLAPLLHPGDILVWAHFKDDTFAVREGGHTHTIAEVTREPSGNLTELKLLQGNQPLFEDQKAAIDEFLEKEDPKKKRPTAKELGKLPGRRIERQTAQQSKLNLDPGTADTNVRIDTKGTTIPVWKWPAFTLLVAAGPPRSARRPATRRQKGDPARVPRRLRDWVPALTAAADAQVFGTLEGALYELRATVEGGGSVAEADVRAVGTAAGKRLAALDRKSPKSSIRLTQASRLQEGVAIIRDFRDSRDIATSRKLDSAYDLTTAELLKHLRWFREALEGAGATKP